MSKKINYGGEGDIYGRHLSQVLGRLLYEERWKRHLTLKCVSTAAEMKQEKIENVELARGHLHWGRIKRLLDFYGKQVVVRLVDVKKGDDK
ncbi:MAG: hypothetical protein NC218_12135 [Acetobacter sp.]|nr:hypothetical protein [Acetobacter sp.]